MCVRVSCSYVPVLQRVLDEALAVQDVDVLLPVLHAQDLIAPAHQDAKGHLPVEDGVEPLLRRGLGAAEEGQEAGGGWMESRISVFC